MYRIKYVQNLIKQTASLYPFIEHAYNLEASFYELQVIDCFILYQLSVFGWFANFSSKFLYLHKLIMNAFFP